MPARVGQHQVERTRDSVELERLDQQPRVADLPAAAAAHEAPQLGFGRPAMPCGLLLERAERAEVAVCVDHLFHRVGAERADQLVLQVRDAHVETEPLHPRASEVGAEPGPFEAAPELAFLRGIAEAGQPDVEPARAEVVEEAPDRLRPADGDDGGGLVVEIPATAPGEGFQGDLVADPLDEDDGARLGGQTRWVSRA